MIENLLMYIQSIISQYGAWGVFLATLIEEIVAPIPSPLVPLAAGFFLLPAELSIFEIGLRSALLIALPVATGITIGSTCIYALGFFGGKPAIEQTQTWTKVNWTDIEKMETRLTRGSGDEIALFMLRAIPLVPGVAISAFSGIVRYPFNEFISITFLGSFTRALILGMIGWQAGELYANYADLVIKFEKYIFIGLTAAAFLFAVYFHFSRKKNSPSH